MSTGIRPWTATAVALLIAACTSPGKPPSAPSGIQGRPVNPANIKRVGRELPPGYEVAAVSGLAGPPAIWGLGADWTADPPHCAALADPAHQPARGISGSGAGGILYALVTDAPPGSPNPDPALVAECPHWTMTNGRSTSRVQLIEAPRIDGAATLGMAVDTTTAVEGGSEIASRANTFTAYLSGYYAFTTSVSDPGSSQPPLPAQAAADLLVKTVAELRS